MSLTIHSPALDDGAHRVVTQIVQCEPNGDHGDQGVPVHRHMVRNGDQRDVVIKHHKKLGKKKEKGSSSMTPLVHLDLRITPQIFEKIQNDPNVIFRGLGEGDK
jgi:hypothetical protein